MYITAPCECQFLALTSFGARCDSAVNQRVLGALYNRGITAMPPPPPGARASDRNTEDQVHHHGFHEDEAPRIFVRLRHNVCTVSIDASGELGLFLLSSASCS